jgi:hypothetical protein
MLARCPGRAGVLSSFELGQPSLGLGRLLQGADGDDQIHDVVGLAGREDALRAIREERAPRLDQIAGAGAFRQLKRDRVVAFRRQQAADAKTQRHPVAGQGLGDERARERLARLLKQGLKRKGFPVAGPFRAAPRPATQGRRLRSAASPDARGQIEIAHTNQILALVSLRLRTHRLRRRRGQRPATAQRLGAPATHQTNRESS